MMASYMRRTPPVDPTLFPDFAGQTFRQLIPQVNGAVMHYAAHLGATHEELFAGVVCPGLVRTGIFRDASWRTRAMVAVLGPLLANSVETAARNPTRVLLEGSGATATYWRKATSYDAQRPVASDPTIRRELMDASRAVTGV
jgi:hypothetical protein